MNKSRYLYGKANTIQISLIDSDKTELVPSSDSPTIYLFNSQPSRQAAAAGTGSIQTISSWTGAGTDRAITITAIADPEPTSATRYKEYYLAINFTLANSGQVQTLIEQIVFERVLAQADNLALNAQDAKAIYPTIGSYLSDALINNFLTGAIDDTKTELQGKGIDWVTVKNPKDFKRAIIFKAIADASLSQIQEDNDKFSKRYDIYSTRANKLLGIITAVVDADNDGTPEQETKSKPSYYIMQR